AFTIVVAGKGGVGKTTVACEIIRVLRDRKETPILAVDADPNSTLGEALGLEAPETVADVLEESQTVVKSLPPGMSKDRYMEERINSTVVESVGVDLFVMGRPGGPGCYCYPNMLLRKHLDTLASNYKMIVMDNEAGMEHISRRTSRNVDLLVIVSDSSMTAVRAAGRIRTIAEQLKLGIGRAGLLLNRAVDGIPEATQWEIEKTGLELFGVLPNDSEVHARSIAGEPILELPSQAVSLKALAEVLEKILPSKAK
ncbi:MAG: AAA family ATPase, partial [bacterium]